MIDRNDQEKDRKRYSDLIINSPVKKKILLLALEQERPSHFRSCLNGKMVKHSR